MSRPRRKALRPERSPALPRSLFPHFHIGCWLFSHFHIFTFPKAAGSHRETAHQFPKFGAVAP